MWRKAKLQSNRPVQQEGPRAELWTEMQIPSGMEVLAHTRPPKLTRGGGLILNQVSMWAEFESQIAEIAVLRGLAVSKYVLVTAKETEPVTLIAGTVGTIPSARVPPSRSPALLPAAS